MSGPEGGVKQVGRANQFGVHRGKHGRFCRLRRGDAPCGARFDETDLPDVGSDRPAARGTFLRNDEIDAIDTASDVGRAGQTEFAVAPVRIDRPDRPIGSTSFRFRAANVVRGGGYEGAGRPNGAK